MAFTHIRDENQLAPNIAELSAGTVGAGFAVVGLGELMLTDSEKVFNFSTFLVGVVTAGVAQYVHHRRELALQKTVDADASNNI